MRVASREGVSQIEIMERWDAAGKESRDIGTFMHAQIERVLHHENPFLMKHFEYTGQYININTDISIKTELKYFQEFMKDNKIHPYRSEWRIYDEVHEIAGTIDLLCQNGQNYEIYDWKRSRKAQPDETIWAYGKNGLEHIPDISFYHYALQQNLYKYILEKNYGIHVSKMHIVIFHPNYDSYKLYEIPHMNKEVLLILSRI
jgi:ATP-dependent exoDNAse (exonuclease V) beta subunit